MHIPRTPALRFVGQVPPIVVIAVFIGLTIAMFRPYVFGDEIVLTADAVITYKAHVSKPILDLFSANWEDRGYAGFPQYIPIRAMEFLLKALGATAFNNLVWPIVATLSSLALVFYFRLRSVSWWAALIACLCAFWLGANFTLLSAGHALKFFVLLFFVLAVACTDRAARWGRWHDAVLMGGCAGAMFLHQPDLAVFFSLFWLAYLGFRLWREPREAPGEPRAVAPPALRVARWAKVLAFGAVPALLLAVGPLWMAYAQQIKNVPVAQGQDAKQKWENVTQWSWPPNECINFVAPGYSGWRSGEQEGPYWGRVGRSPGWDINHPSGTRNYMISSAYLGAIPVALAVFAVFLSGRSRHRGEILFWAVAAGVALVLSFGKFAPVFALFHKLPIVNHIRNPSMFLQVFQVAIAILCGFGAHALITLAPRSVERDGGAEERKRVQSFFWIVAGITILAALTAVSFGLVESRSIARFQQQGWEPRLAEAIAATRIRSVWHLAVMGTLLTGVFACFAFPSITRGRLVAARHGAWIILSLGVIVAADAFVLSRHYIQTMPKSYIEGNTVTSAVRLAVAQGRAAFLTQYGFYSVWTAYLFPYQGIRLFNTLPPHRLPADYETFFNRLGNTPLRIWQLCAVHLIISPRTVAAELPAAQFPRIGGFNAGIGEDNNLVVAGGDTNAAHMLIQNLNVVPQFVLVRRSRVVSDDEALHILAEDATHDPRVTILLEEGSEDLVPEREHPPGEVLALQNRPGRIQLKVVTEGPGILRIANKYDPDWIAQIDGEPAPILRADFLFQALAVPAGVHTIDLRYAPSKTFFQLQVAGILLCTGALCAAGWGLWSAKEVLGVRC